MTRGFPAGVTRALRLILIIAPCLYSLYVAAQLWLASPGFRIQYIPDDAFYYLTLARNFARLGEWTFDLGVSVTTGFHLLHAYWLAGISWLFDPSPETYIRIAGVATWMVGLAAFIMGGIVAWRTRRVLPALLFAVLMISRNLSLDAISTVEWPWVATISAVYILLLDRLGTGSGVSAAALLFFCGFLGSLARSDFGLMPAAMAASFLLAPGLPMKRLRVAATLTGLAGAVAGVGAVTLHNYIVSGSLVQSSARMKLYWMEFAGPAAKPILRAILYLFGTPSVLTLALFSLIMILFLTAGALLYLRKGVAVDDPDRYRSGRALWIGCLFTVAGYVLFFSFNPLGIQHWYTSHIVVPLFLIGVLPMASWRFPKFLNAALAAVLSVTLASQAWHAAHFFSRPEWPHQERLYRAAEYLRASPPEARVGSWNAGILGFYTGGAVVNLDGLVNNGIYAYAVRNDLPRYIDSVSIGYVVDFGNMFDGTVIRARGGYDRPDFLGRLEPVKRFDEETTGWAGLTLYKVTPPLK